LESFPDSFARGRVYYFPIGEISPDSPRFYSS